MGYDYQQQLEFNFEGQFLGFVGPAHKSDYLPKYLRVRVLSEEMQIKLPKALRLAGGLNLQPGERILVTGRGKFNRYARELKLKAAQIVPLPNSLPDNLPDNLPNSLPDNLLNSLVDDPSDSLGATLTNGCEILNGLVAAAPVNSAKSKIKVLVCQKSGCLKKGGRGLCEALQQALCQRNLDQHVTIKPTGCLKCCSSAPNLVMMPGNRRYKEVRPKTLGQIADSIAQSLGMS
ncbi:MAG: (2Fe-2S) ferredoxin domain-containing protein [Elainella sp. C42_A2020_010]|nr:(2Fe-2S) ferredoxin domain-containing protein [Elainella sp. C42_A2020_010]RNJ66757.1 MAG: (2Fe-2S) ferredoxin domain-containing protein [Leptolyngbya sp. IPPAS B-1204]